MNGEEVYKVAKELIGNIQPIGCSNTDESRFENLKELCHVVENLFTDIDDMAFRNKGSHEHSVKRSADYANDFIKRVSEANQTHLTK